MPQLCTKRPTRLISYSTQPQWCCARPTAHNYHMPGWAADYQCREIKDRNGNYLTINYDTSGRIDTVVDTLARIFKFNYAGSDLLRSHRPGPSTDKRCSITGARFFYSDQPIQTKLSQPDCCWSQKQYGRARAHPGEA